MSFAMTRTEREAFLAEVHVAVISVDDPGRGPLTIPVWYRYEPGGDVFFTTGGESRKAGLIRAAGRLSLCVQTETAPYKYVSVEGRASIETPDYQADSRAVAIRYLGERGGEAYLKSSGGGGAGTVLVRLQPEHWLTVDYGQRPG
jgi:nitroimidazol reductase NimA-like FMN-containing flavoprotein (pyridoxamine 5'-phosphate oxidase superfamily)